MALCCTNPPADDDAAASPGSLEEVLQAEAEVLAAELQELEEDGDVDPQLLDELESGVEAAAESLVTMREARSYPQENLNIALQAAFSQVFARSRNVLL